MTTHSMEEAEALCSRIGMLVCMYVYAVLDIYVLYVCIYIYICICMYII